MLNVECQIAIYITVREDFESLIIAEGFEERECLGVFGVCGWCQCLSHESHIGGGIRLRVIAAHRCQWMRLIDEEVLEVQVHGSETAHLQD